MSWDQSYSIPSMVQLLIALTHKHPQELLERELLNHGLTITKTEMVILDDGQFRTVTGERIYLSDGRIFEPKLVRRETADGNWGNDVYEYRLQDEQVEVEYVDRSVPYEDSSVVGGNCCADGHGRSDDENVGC